MANSEDPDKTAERGKYCRPGSDCWEWQLVKTLIRLLRMATSIDTDQTAKNGKYYRPWSDYWEWQTV